jgi:hypothetical protein
MNFDRNELYKNPDSNFNVPPPNFEGTDPNGWTTLARAIVNRNCGLRKYVNYAIRWKEKEHEWKTQNATFNKQVSCSLLQRTFL